MDRVVELLVLRADGSVIRTISIPVREVQDWLQSRLGRHRRYRVTTGEGELSYETDCLVVPSVRHTDGAGVLVHHATSRGDVTMKLANGEELTHEEKRAKEDEEKAEAARLSIARYRLVRSLLNKKEEK
jgi:hypothetical protein